MLPIRRMLFISVISLVHTFRKATVHVNIFYMFIVAIAVSTIFCIIVFQVIVRHIQYQSCTDMVYGFVRDKWLGCRINELFLVFMNTIIKCVNIWLIFSLRNKSKVHNFYLFCSGQISPKFPHWYILPRVLQVAVFGKLDCLLFATRWYHSYIHAEAASFGYTETF